MQITANEFIKSPAIYLDRAMNSTIYITKDGQTIAVLAKPDSTPISNSLLGLFADTGIENSDDIKAMRTGE